MIADRRILSVVVGDPGADCVFPLMRVPTGHQFTIEDAYVSLEDDISTSTANYCSFALYNAGSDGLQTDLISGSAGGTVGWSKNVAKQIAVTDGSGKLTAGQWLAAKYDEEGTIGLPFATLVIEYVDGIGEKANA